MGVMVAVGACVTARVGVACGVRGTALRYASSVAAAMVAAWSAAEIPGVLFGTLQAVKSKTASQVRMGSLFLFIGSCITFCNVYQRQGDSKSTTLTGFTIQFNSTTHQGDKLIHNG